MREAAPRRKPLDTPADLHIVRVQKLPDGRKEYDHPGTKLEKQDYVSLGDDPTDNRFTLYGLPREVKERREREKHAAFAAHTSTRVDQNNLELSSEDIQQDVEAFFAASDEEGPSPE